MFRGGPLCDADKKAALEAANGLEQVEYIAYLVEQGATEVRESHLLRLHELAVAQIYPCAGHYRTDGVEITNSPHTPPEAALVKNLSIEAIEWINSERGKRPALERAAYALWRFNWIHPFFGGNGRTSRALAYLIVCLEDQRMFPGSPQMPSLIYNHRRDYVDALRAVDATERVGAPDFSVMTDFLRSMLMKQFAAAIDKLSRPSSP